jgi:Cu2+-exporting ATPase
VKKYEVSGMSCAACSARVEKAVSQVSGVEKCSVNLLTNSMTVEGTADDKDIIRAVEAAGYGAKSSEGAATENKSDALKDTKTPALIKRLVSSSVFLIILMYFSMGHSMMSLPLPQFFEGNAIAVALAQMILCVCVMIINKKFFINGIKGVIHKSPNMDTLVAMGSGASFLWSVAVVFAMMKSGESHLLH